MSDNRYNRSIIERFVNNDSLFNFGGYAPFGAFIPPPPPSPSPTPSITPTNTPTPSITPTITISPTTTKTPTPTPTQTGTPTPTPTPSSTPPTSYDPDAQAFFDAISTAGGSLTDGEKTATNDLVLDLKGYGLWSKMIGLYPVVGSSSVEHQFNLADPTQYNLTFVGSWTHSTSGVNPTGGYANTGIIPSVIDFQTSGSVHYSMYITEDVGNSGYDIGSFTSSGGDWGAISEFVGNNTTYIGVGTGWATTGNGGSTKKNWLWTNISSRSYIYRDGTQILDTAKTISAGSTIQITLNGNNANTDGNVVDRSSRSWALCSIGLGMNSTEAGDYHTAVEAFQTALGRNNI